jgi:hypothetical protein
MFVVCQPTFELTPVVIEPDGAAATGDAARTATPRQTLRESSARRMQRADLNQVLMPAPPNPVIRSPITGVGTANRIS